MSLSEMIDAWAQLVSLTDIYSPPVPITKNKFLFGRNADRDISFAGNNLVSGSHCFIERTEDGKVCLYDTSTNGTLLNMNEKIKKGEFRELLHGDEFHIVHKTNFPHEDIGYLFQDLEALRNETRSDLEEDSQATIDYASQNENDSTFADEDVNNCITDTNKRKHEDETKEGRLSPKKVCPNTKEKFVLEKAGDVISESTKQKKGKTSKPKPEGTLPDKHTKQQPTLAPPVPKPAETETDEMAETLVCSICTEILHDCISLQPCMHSYCSGCYSEWMERSNECPSCRMKVERINKNHIVNNLVEAYLKIKSDKRRPQEDLDQLDWKNKITRDMLFPDKNAKGCTVGSYEFDSDDEEEDEYDEEDEDNDIHIINPFPLRFGQALNPQPQVAQGNMLFGLGAPFFGAARPVAPVLCRQCPGYKAPVPQVGGILSQANTGPNAIANIGAGPSTGDTSTDVSDTKVLPEPFPRVCVQQQNHVLCQCCLSPMPDMRAMYARGEPRVPPQSCSNCFRNYCHAYWGCLKKDCNGCLTKLKDMKFGKKCLNSLVLDNPHESNIIKSYLEVSHISVSQLWADCLAHLVTGEYTTMHNQMVKDGMNTVLCYACSLWIFKDLAYSYRKNIPKDQLPGEVTSRPDCYWGHNCRTQRSKPEHARRFNHICDQTRTA